VGPPAGGVHPHTPDAPRVVLAEGVRVVRWCGRAQVRWCSGAVVLPGHPGITGQGLAALTATGTDWVRPTELLFCDSTTMAPFSA
jgi:hypothetical protein